MRPVDVDVHQVPHRHRPKLTSMSGVLRQIGNHMAADVFCESAPNRDPAEFSPIGLITVFSRRRHHGVGATLLKFCHIESGAG